MPLFKIAKLATVVVSCARLVYTYLINVQDDKYVSKVALNLEQACKLVDAGFDYVADMENGKIQKAKVTLSSSARYSLVWSPQQQQLLQR